MKSRFYLSCAMVATLGGVATTVQAQEIEEIVVTAQKRAENAQDVPIAISALSGDALSDKNVGDAGDLVKMFPALSVKQQGTINNGLSIRGVGTQNFHVTAQPAVGQYLDEVSMVTPFTSKLGLYDMERVEVLRGPQNTLFGRNTTGGAVNYISRKPDVTKGVNGYAKLGYGRFDQLSAEGALGLPISETVAIRVAGKYERRDGAFNNLVAGDKLGGYKNYGARASLAWEPDSATKVLLSGHVGYFRSTPVAYRGVGLLAADGVSACPLLATGGMAQFEGTNDCLATSKGVGLVNPSTAKWRDVYAAQRMTGQIDFEGGLLNIQHDFGPVSLTLISGYDVTKVLYQQDFAGMPYFQSAVGQDAKYKVFSQEARLASNGDGPIKWIVGGYYSHENDDLMTIIQNNRTPAPVIAVPSVLLDQKVNILSAYGQVNADLSGRLHLEVGLRYTHDKRQGVRTPFSMAGTSTGLVGGVPFGYDTILTKNTVLGLLDGVTTTCAIGVLVCAGPSDDVQQVLSKVGGKVTLSYDLADDVMGYASYSRGFKSGSFDVRAQAIYLGTAANPVGPETLDAYEVGLKSTLLGRRLQINGAVFYYDWQGLQAFVNSAAGPAFVNVPKTEIYGAEIELQANLPADFSVNGGVSYVHSEIKDDGGYSLVSNGAPVAGAPKWTATGTLSKAIYFGDDSKATLSVTGRYTSTQQFDFADAAFAKLDSTFFVDLFAGYEFGPDGRYSVSATVDNLTGVKTCSPISNNGPLTGTNGCLPNEGVALYRANIGIKF
ncbi:TonB-dependent receptor [Novosphingobium album (ex Hu et al. 2023)]|uniref:TonB-dependent receptor n=1 Tax=Novosphingobium album (ex Hu et al. 2023) TaxID=2930093 RepID=A0ABT0B7C7_9SPHN|nr:TonB-dependent receptor [Novosphingobium album (ex Hu et al. 2023)]MCJ2180980.1 TonB-dependent receptor [Novosphingobium album (ex Hu et al. 2023)]